MAGLLEIEPVGLFSLIKGTLLLATHLNPAMGKASKIYGPMVQLGQEIKQEAQRLVPEETGRLRASIKEGVERTNDEIAVRVYTNAHNARHVEFGRKPGKMPPVGAFVAQARKRGVSPYLLARAVGRAGVRKRSYLRAAYARKMPPKGQFDKQMAKRIEAYWGMKVRNG